VDDGSTDDTYKALGELAGRIHPIRPGRGRLSVVRNRGIEAATGEFIAFQDSDDL